MNDSAAPFLAEIAIPVRWRDLDAFNHVNNASFLTYLEEARLHWFGTIGDAWMTTNAAPVVAAITANFRKQLSWPAQLIVQLSCERLGNSSLTMGFRIVDATNRNIIYSDGQTVLVWIDTASGKSVSLPDAIRGACETING